MGNTTINRSDCLCGVCAMLATATPTLHTHATQRAAEQCSQPGCVPPRRIGGHVLPVCPDCRQPHDPARCAAEGAGTCDCCAAIEGQAVSS